LPLSWTSASLAEAACDADSLELTPVLIWLG
jgi:hypothetical protein